MQTNNNVNEKPTARTINATYRTLAEYQNVEVNIPGLNDKFMKWIPAHTMQVGEETIPLPGHYRRGDIFGGKFLTRNFFIDYQEVMESSFKMNADVKVVEKTDHHKGGEKSLIIEIRLCQKKLNRVGWYLSFGCPTGDFLIPGTEKTGKKFVNFKKATPPTAGN